MDASPRGSKTHQKNISDVPGPQMTASAYTQKPPLRCVLTTPYTLRTMAKRRRRLMESFLRCVATAPCTLRMTAKRRRRLMDSSVLPPDNPDKGLTDCLTTVSGIGWRACLKRGSVRYIVTRTINIPKGRGNRWKLLPRVSQPLFWDSS